MSVSDAKLMVKRLLPDAIVRLVRAHRNLTWRERRIYWRSWFRRAFETRSHPVYQGGTKVSSVVFVCRGNIIRSPMAAALLKQYLSDMGVDSVTVSSAGLHAKPGQAADSRALAVAGHFGISLDEHRAQPLTTEMVMRTDVFFVMDSLLEAELLGRYPQARHKVFLPSTCDGVGNPRPIEIADPYDGDTTDIHRCYELLQQSIRHLTSAFLRSATSATA